MRSEVLGLPVDVLSRVETINMIDGWLRQSVRKPRMVVTAYSEFYVKAQKDRVFAESFGWGEVQPKNSRNQERKNSRQGD
ncbi:MAG: hypothetical protein UX01_C0009G0010 [Candidatus Collierbacteria bacterium GW2011_GWB2_45_17]|uniref:Uncharacterized protein n=1 Tax=Candidatus Collierbacteria bacterium GW2011_GWB2_45_17 TaxID=1618388 RepID=A0A837IHQ5_9BACT|nr:MAG: hypothetical protein UX01_C0009G0010 [Candidatus Collierbacteria bacterium GW2011_GWB2_45_17]